MLGNIFIKVINLIISSVGNALSLIIGILPHSPFHYLENSSVSEWLGYLNWIIPIDYIITFLEAWLVAIGMFYIYQSFARWVKLIQ